jgi:hypothetical protein
MVIGDKNLSWVQVGKEAFEAFMDYRSAIAMYMFIIEESIQTANMGNWILFKANLYDKMKENITYIRNELAQPLKSFADGPVGYVAYPLNICYSLFAQATLKALEAQEVAIDELAKSTK